MPAWSVEVWLKSIPFYRIYTYLVTEHSNSKKQHFSASSVDTTSKLEMQHKVFEINWNWWFKIYHGWKSIIKDAFCSAVTLNVVLMSRSNKECFFLKITFYNCWVLLLNCLPLMTCPWVSKKLPIFKYKLKQIIFHDITKQLTIFFKVFLILWLNGVFM